MNARQRKKRDRKREVLHITSAEQLIAIYGQPDLRIHGHDIPVRALQDLMWGPETFMSVVRADTSPEKIREMEEWDRLVEQDNKAWGLP